VVTSLTYPLSVYEEELATIPSLLNNSSGTWSKPNLCASTYPAYSISTRMITQMRGEISYKLGMPSIEKRGSCWERGQASSIVPTLIGSLIGLQHMGCLILYPESHSQLLRHRHCPYSLKMWKNFSTRLPRWRVKEYMDLFIGPHSDSDWSSFNYSMKFSIMMFTITLIKSFDK